MNRKYFCISVLPILLLLLISPTNFKARAENDAPKYSLILDLFKWDFYFQALEQLDSASDELKDDFNFWLYKGLAYQRTSQLNKAIEAYENAYKINPNATNILNRVRSLSLEAEKATYQDKIFEFDGEKSFFLMGEAKKLRQAKDFDKAYRTFLQAVDYDNTLLRHDDGFISEGEQFFRQQVREKKDFAMLFLGIFQFLQGDLDSAKASLNRYRNLPTRPPALDQLADLYTGRLGEITGQRVSAQEALRLRMQQERERIEQERRNAEKRAQTYPRPSHTTSLAPASTPMASHPDTIIAEPSGFKERYNERRAMLAFNQLSRVEPTSEEEAVLIRKLGKAGHHSKEIMNFLVSRLDPTNDYYAVVILDAIEDIGAPSALIAIDPLLEMIKTAPYPEDGFRQLALLRVSRMRLAPEKVIPLIIDEYSNATTDRQKRFMGDCAVHFGIEGLPTFYHILEESWRANKRPVAELINRITGEKIDELMKR